eukprot:5659542-Amphidinium_carterae.1
MLPTAVAHLVLENHALSAAMLPIMAPFVCGFNFDRLKMCLRKGQDYCSTPIVMTDQFNELVVKYPFRLLVYCVVTRLGHGNLLPSKSRSQRFLQWMSNT